MELASNFFAKKKKKTCIFTFTVWRFTTRFFFFFYKGKGKGKSEVIKKGKSVVETCMMTFMCESHQKHHCIKDQREGFSGI